MKVVKSYDNSFSANLSKGLLKEAGIESYILNENISMIAGIFNKDLLSIQLTVDDKDFDEAVKILAASDNSL
jgi:hypothetical protein